MILKKKYSIFYRDIPDELENFVARDGNISFSKDGIKELEDGHRCPRLSLIVYPSNNQDTDKTRIANLERLLTLMLKLNKIVAYV